MKRRWLLFAGLPRSVADAAWSFAGAGAGVVESRWWWVAAAAAGMLPLLACAPFGASAHQIVSAFALTPLLLGAARIDRSARGVAALLLAYAAHTATAITLSFHAPDLAGPCMPGGEEYWAKQLVWIRTGEDPEYVLANWVPAHFQLFGVVVALSYLSLGAMPLIRGFYEVDLMNYYVGRLLAASDDSWWPLFVGWHPWSVMRGICYSLLIYEVTSLSLSRLTGRELSTTRKRHARWIGAAGFFAADCVVKYVTLDVVRGTLAAHLAT